MKLDFDVYKYCGNQCTCQVTSPLCFVKLFWKTQYELVSDERISCGLAYDCFCNFEDDFDSKAWDSLTKSFFGAEQRAPGVFELPSYDFLLIGYINLREWPQL